MGSRPSRKPEVHYNKALLTFKFFDMKLIICKTILFLFLAFFFKNSNCQTEDLQQIKEDLYSINKNFDSSHFLSFDSEIVLSSDTVFGRYESERQFATYILNGKNIYYKVGGMEFMQNDSLTITASDQEQMMVVTKQSFRSKADLFPLRQFVDSVLNYFVDKYRISITGSDTIKRIKFVANVADLPFTAIIIDYYDQTKLLKAIEISYRQQPNFDDYNDSISAPSVPKIATSPIGKKLSMFFNSYRFIDNEEVFKDHSYILFDRIRKQYVSTGKYKDYRLISTNLETSQAAHDDIETPAPPITSETNN
jgi:hypothetical protein